MQQAYSFRRLLAAGAAACASLSVGAAGAQAAVINDPAGDFLGTYIGPKSGDMDVVATQGVYNGVTLRLDATLNGAVGTTPGASYVWGLQRGQGAARFGAFAPGILFDSVVSITPGGAAVVRDLVNGTATNLPASAVVISGNKLSVTLNASLLPSLGLTTPRYLIDLWPRNGGANANIADFAPDISDAPISLDFPTPITASAQTEMAVDNASFAFDRIAARLRDRRTGDATSRFGGFLTADARQGERGLSGSLIGKSNTSDLTGGIDYEVIRGLFVGAAVRGSRSSIRLTDASHLDVNATAGLFYAGWSADHLYVNGFVDAASLDFKSNRTIMIGLSALSGRAEPKGNSVSAGAQLGYAFHSGSLSFGPLVDIIATRVHVEGYAETEPLGFGSSVDARDHDSTRLGLGAEIVQTSAAPWGSATLHASGRFVQELSDAADAFTYRFNAQPENSFLLNGPGTGRQYGVLDLGADARVGQLKIGLSYSPRFDGHTTLDQQVSASLRLDF